MQIGYCVNTILYICWNAVVSALKEENATTLETCDTGDRMLDAMDVCAVICCLSRCNAL